MCVCVCVCVLHLCRLYAGPASERPLRAPGWAGQRGRVGGELPGRLSGLLLRLLQEEPVQRALHLCGPVEDTRVQVDTHTQTHTRTHTHSSISAFPFGVGQDHLRLGGKGVGAGCVGVTCPPGRRTGCLAAAAGWRSDPLPPVHGSCASPPRKSSPSLGPWNTCTHHQHGEQWSNIHINS